MGRKRRILYSPKFAEIRKLRKYKRLVEQNAELLKSVGLYKAEPEFIPEPAPEVVAEPIPEPVPEVVAEPVPEVVAEPILKMEPPAPKKARARKPRPTTAKKTTTRKPRPTTTKKATTRRSTRTKKA